MFVFGNIILGAARVLGVLLNIYMWVIIIRALISWVNPDPYNPIVQFLTRATEPVLRPLRRLVPTWKLGIDLSPLIAVLIIYFLEIAVVDTLVRVGSAMR
jgi:YggT family protein